MAIPAQQCDIRQLEKLLEQDLSEKETRGLEQHLSDCPTCQKHLEQLVGSSMFWQNTQSHLKPEQFIQSLFERPTRSNAITTEGSLPPVDGNEESALRYVAQWLAPTDDPHSMGRLGSYEIVGLIGIGGMGIVVKGFDPALSRSVAIKLLSPHLALNGAARQRFAREAKAAAAVAHENVLAIHAIETQQDVPYLVMPYIKGASLEKRLRQEGALPLIDLLRIAHQIAMGLAEAHAQGLVHRDVKPANILLAQGSERLKISDFGLARAADDASLTRSGTITGTPLYMSPEQARGEPVDQRSDIFSFGSLLYEVCAGHAPFRAETPFGILRRIGEDTPPPIQESRPEVPTWLCSVIEAMMAKSPNDRQLSAQQLAGLFRIGLTHQQQPAGSRLPDQLLPFAQTVPQNSTARWLGLSASLTLLATLILWLLPWSTFYTKAPVSVGPNTTDNSSRIEDEVGADDAVAPVSAQPTSIDRGLEEMSQSETAFDSLPVMEANGTDGPQPTESDPNGATSTHPNSTGSSTSEPVTVDPIEVIENPTADDSLPYEFEEDEVIGYELDLNLHRQDGSLLIDGQILLQVDAINEDNYEFKYLLTLDYQRIDTAMMLSPFATSLIEGEVGQLQRCERKGRIKVGKDGRILGRSRQSELPAQLGPVAELLFPRLPKKKRKNLQQKSLVTVHSVPTSMMRSPGVGTPSMDLERVTKTSATRPGKDKNSDSKPSHLRSFTIRMTDKTEVDDRSLTAKAVGSYQFDSKRRRIDSLELNRQLDDDAQKTKFAKLEFKLNSIPTNQLPQTIQKHEDDQ